MRLRKVDKKLNNLFKSPLAIPITGIYFRLDPPGEELSEDVTYKLEVWLTITKESRMDQNASLNASNFEKQLWETLTGCPGIELKEIDVRSEADVSIDDLRYFRRFNVDYRSVTPPDTLPPPDI